MQEQMRFKPAVKMTATCKESHTQKYRLHHSLPTVLFQKVDEKPMGKWQNG